MWSPLALAALAAVFTALPAPATEPAGETHLSLEGFSGFGVIPHAQTLPNGSLAAGWSDLSPSFTTLPDAWSYMFGIGLFERVELTGKLLRGPLLPGNTVPIRDLSAGLKLQLFKKDGWPSLAIGSQDIQGNTLFPSHYAVTSWELGPFHLSAGYGWESENLDGGFGGIEWKPLRWFSASAEHAGGAERASARLTAPLFYGASLSGLVSHSFEDEGDTNYGVEFSIPLGGAPRTAPATADSVATAAAPATPAAPTDDTTNFVATPVAPAMGVQAPAVPTATLAPAVATLCVQDLPKHRSLTDAMGAAIRVAAPRIPENAGRAQVMLVRENRPVLSALLTPATLSGLSAGGAASAPQVDFANPDSCADEKLFARAPARRGPVELILEPNLTTFVGTEVATVDADLSLRARLQLPLTQGLSIALSLLSPSVHTENFDDGEALESYRAEAGVDQGLLQFYSRPSARWHSLFSLGYLRLLRDDTLFLAHENSWYFNRGRDSLRMNVGLLDQTAGSLGFGIFEYAHHFVRHDTSLSVAGGRFAAGDSGGRVELTRFFGDTTVTVFVKSAGGRDETAGGLRLSFPLGGRVAGGSGGFVLRGSERWSHALQSTFGGSGGGANFLRPDLLIEPLPDRNLRDSYTDYDRATPAWAEAHGERLRDAYLGETN